MDDVRATGDERLLRDLTVQLADLAAVLNDVRNPVDAALLVDVAARTMPHTDHAGLTYFRPRREPETIAASDDLPRRVDAIQYALDEGPCLEAIDESDLQRVDDLISDPRWPRFAREAVDRTGVRSMLSARLVLEGEDRAALNFYSKQTSAFGDLDLGVAALLASFMSVVLNSDFHRTHAANLEIALEGSRTIGAAIGILMATKQLTSDQAFEQLRQASRHLNRKLRDIADEVTVTGELPSN